MLNQKAFSDARAHRTAVVQTPKWLLLWTFALFAALVSSQLRAQYRYTRWTEDEGLPQSGVQGITQTSDGFIWVATLNGLARFDGVRFLVFDKSNSPGITSNRFVAMVRGAGDDLWLASEDGNVVRFHEGHFESMAKSRGLRSRSVRALTASDRGAVWALSDGGVFHWNQRSDRFELDAMSAEARQFHALWWPGTGFWAQRGAEIICFNRGHRQTFPIRSAINPDKIRGVAANANGQAWLGTEDGQFARLGAIMAHLRYADDSYVLQGPAHTTWNVQLQSQRFRRVLHVQVGEVDQAIPFTAFLPDTEGNIWLGSEDAGLIRIQRESIRVLTAENGQLASDNVYPVFASRAGDIWSGSWPSGLSQVRDGRLLRTWTKSAGLPGLMTAITEDNHGEIWVAGHGGVRILAHGRLRTPRLPFTLSDTTVQALLQLPSGEMVFGTSKGLEVLQEGRSFHLSEEDGLASNDVRTLILDRNHDVWIGGYGGVTRIHNGVFTRWTEANGLPSDSVRCIYQDLEGEIWIGTYDGGISWFHDGHWDSFNEQQGLYDNGAFQILQDNDGWFWISCNRGIYRILRSQLIEAAKHSGKRVTSVAYGKADGLLTAECNGGLWPAGAKDEQGRLFFPTQRGLAMIDPRHKRAVSVAPKVSIDEVMLDNVRQSDTKTLTIDPKHSDVAVRYTAINFIKPEQITFRYRLIGIDDAWQEIGLRREVYFSHLPPGSYRFEVLAQNSNGVLSKSRASLNITVVPPFYRRRSFLVGAVVAVLLGISGAWKSRVKQLNDRQKGQHQFAHDLIASQENERSRIAADLHDSLGQRLIIISNLAVILLRTKGRIRTEEEKREAAEEISSEANAAMEETRAISYALRPFQLDRLGLTQAIRALCKSVSRASNIAVSVELTNIDDAFHQDRRIHVYRIVQESLNNVVKHSHADHASVTISLTDGQVTLTIQDNGIGFQTPSGGTSGRPGGFGVIGMRERIMPFGGTLDIKTGATTGTVLQVDLPCEPTELPKRTT